VGPADHRGSSGIQQSLDTLTHGFEREGLDTRIEDVTESVAGHPDSGRELTRDGRRPVDNAVFQWREGT